MGIPIVTGVEREGMRWARQGDWRVKVYSEGGDCCEERIAVQTGGRVAWVWVLCEDMPGVVYNRLRRAAAKGGALCS
jgi:hypothetical protein